MEALAQEYIDQLDNIKAHIQASEQLATYLDSEDEEDYNALKDLYEPYLYELHKSIASSHPLQLIDFEKRLLDEELEGLFIPKVLGYAVLRGEINDQFRYMYSQRHFKDILMFIINSPNFEMLKQRIGLSIQMGFAFSTDIWITNLLNEVPNKQIRRYLSSLKLMKYRDAEARKDSYVRYIRQFKNENYLTANFPEDQKGLLRHFNNMKRFFIYRHATQQENSSVLPHIRNFVTNKAFFGTREHLEVCYLYGLFYDLDAKATKELTEVINKNRLANEDFDASWLDLTLELYNHEEDILTQTTEERLQKVIDTTLNDQISEYYKLNATIHREGYMSEQTQEEVKVFYNRHEGMSVINECVRRAIANQFRRFLTHLEPKEYAEFFELTKYYRIYMDIFSNQTFNQTLKYLALGYVKSLLKVFTDKRGKDYQDIKKFVTVTFEEFNFLNKKEIVELFKTKRKKKPATA